LMIVKPSLDDLVEYSEWKDANACDLILVRMEGTGLMECQLLIENDGVCAHHSRPTHTTANLTAEFPSVALRNTHRSLGARIHLLLLRRSLCAYGRQQLAEQVRWSTEKLNWRRDQGRSFGDTGQLACHRDRFIHQ